MSEQNKRMTGKLLHKKEKETNNQFKKVCFESNPVSTNVPLLYFNSGFGKHDIPLIRPARTSITY